MKILVVDDHVLIRESLRGVLRELSPEATIVEATNAQETMRLVAEHPDLALVLLDLNCRTVTGLRSSLSCASATPPFRSWCFPATMIAPMSFARSSSVRWGSFRKPRSARFW